MSGGWTTRDLGNVCEVIAGQSPESEHYNGAGEGLPFYQGKKDFGPRFLSEPTVWTRIATKEAEAGDILMSVRAPVGPINIATERICIGRGLAAIRVGDRIDRDFLFYTLLAQQKCISGNEGAVFSSINKKQIQAIKLPLPPLPEQKRIVSILDDVFQGIDAAIANTEKNLASSDQLYSIYLDTVLKQKVGDWAESRLGDLVSIRHGFAFKSEYFVEDGEYVLLTPGNFFEGGGYRDRGEKQKYYDGEIPDGFVLSEGALLVAMTEQAAGLLGSPLIVPEGGRFLHNQRLGLVVPRAGIPFSNDFFFHAFNAPAFRREIHATASGVKVRHTSPAKLGDAVISFPRTLEDQQEVAARLSEVRQHASDLRGIYERKLESLAELKQSILQKAFSGGLAA